MTTEPTVPAPPTAPEADASRRIECGWDNDGNWYAKREFPDLYPAIGAQLRDAREARGLNQQQVANSIGRSRSSVANIERGTQHLPLHNWVGHCQILGLDPADVISKALQGVGPMADPLPAQADKRTAALRRHLEAAHKDIGTLLADLPGATR